MSKLTGFALGLLPRIKRNSIMNKLIRLCAMLVLLNSLCVSAETIREGSFIEKSKAISGSWRILKAEEGALVLEISDDFKAKSGPDLKVFLSSHSFSDANGKNASKSSTLVGALKKAKGSQRYELPTEIKLSDFKSLLVHCEKYSILWGGSDL
jgi:hypothetical protein